MREDVVYPLLALVIMVVIAIMAYHFLEGWDFLTSSLYATATVTTIGYSEVSPKTLYGKVFTIVFMIGGVATGFYALIRLSHFSKETFEKRFRKIAEKLEDMDERKRV
ncbi:MAG: potassium channel family protein [Candidatus Anstonellales archaeon]